MPDHDSNPATAQSSVLALSREDMRLLFSGARGTLVATDGSVIDCSKPIVVVSIDPNDRDAMERINATVREKFEGEQRPQVVTLGNEAGSSREKASFLLELIGDQQAAPKFDLKEIAPKFELPLPAFVSRSEDLQTAPIGQLPCHHWKVRGRRR